MREVVTDTKSKNRSIVMVDWSRYNEPTPETRDEFLWHQMLLTLLYDDVLAQDETLVCSKKMAGWFPDSKTFSLLEQLFECGGIRVLKRPLERYPVQLQEQAVFSPIAARREQLEKFSVNNDGTPIHFDGGQLAFHSRLEALLLNHPDTHRHAGRDKKLGKDIMQEFGSLLVTALTDDRYKKWLRSRFRNIIPAIGEEFVQFVNDPHKAIERLKQERPDQAPRFTPHAGSLVFSTALAVQVAATYPEKQAKELQDLIETVFARPLCQDEGAEGRYGQLLRDLPIPLDDAEGESGIVDVVKVEVELKVPLTLPLPGPGFAEVIQEVRERPSGRALRNAMNQLESDLTFDNATNAWKAVASDIASLVSSVKAKELELRMLAVTAGRGLLYGAVADLMLHPPHSIKELPIHLPGPLLGALFSVGGDLYSGLRQADLIGQRISEPLEEAVQFTCVQHPTIKASPNLGT